MLPAYSDYPNHVKQLIAAALEAADPAAAVTRQLRRDRNHIFLGKYRYRLGQGRVFLIAVGKAALAMGRAALGVLEDAVSAGVIITKQSEAAGPRRYNAPQGVTVFEAAHPVADESSITATAAVIDLMGETAAGDLVICLISGGTSALLTKPVIPLGHWQRLTEVLLASGCTINELNCVRKQLDLVKGGGLARLAHPATVVSLILSDVVGNRLDIIGSGPTAEDADTPAEALTLLHRYSIPEKVPPEAWITIAKHLTSEEAAFSSSRYDGLEVHNLIVGDVRQSATAATRAAADMGFDARLLTAYLEGEAREVGRVVAALAKEAAPSSCLVLGGETTVTVHGDGKGGRNQELALATAIALDEWRGIAVAGLATDGEDGPTDAAGAVVTGETMSNALTAGLDPLGSLVANDSHNFFTRLSEQTGIPTLIRTGPTGTNVNDLVIILKYETAIATG